MTDRILIFTYKDGLLARLAHDLQITCHRFEITRTGTEVRGRFVLDSLRVDGAMERGRLAAGTLSQGDRRKIEATMADEILEVRRFGEATFTGTATVQGAAVRIEGSLGLHGRTAGVAPITAQRRGDVWFAEVSLVPSRWGIAPYRALAGALKLQDRVTVQISLSANIGDADATWLG